MTKLISQLFRDYSDEYIRTHPGLSVDQLKVINAIRSCQSGELGYTVYQCKECGNVHTIDRSCGNRHCPVCQYAKTQDWLKKQLEKALPCLYFMITFTIAESLRFFFKKYQKIAYDAFFKASSQTLMALAKDERFLGADLLGFLGVLQTWDRMLFYHPHIHYIVPGGGMIKAENRWVECKHDFFAPIWAMSKIMRAKFKDEIKKAGLFHEIDPSVWKSGFNVHSEPVGSGHNAIKYLAPYVFKVAISNARIVKIENRKVYFRVKKKKSRRMRTVELDVMEFIHRFLQHVLPKGFMKVRSYGFMNANCKVKLNDIRSRIITQVELNDNNDSAGEPIPLTENMTHYCPDCGGELIYLTSILPHMFERTGTG